MKKIFFTIYFVFLLILQTEAAPAGRLDSTFPQLLASGANVTAITQQTDGKILIAGEFTTRGAVLRNDMIRINADGSLDTSFSIGSGTEAPSLIRFVKQQPDGKILVAGYITQINGSYVRPIIRLNSDGSIDSTFNLSGIDVTFVFDLDVQTDGKILISAMNLAGFRFVTRLKTDGSNDQGIAQPLFSNGHTVSFLLSENKILIGGRFSYSAGQRSGQNLVKLNLDGTIDTTFAASITNSIFDLTIKTTPISAGKILIWGKFDTVNATTRRNIAVINSDGNLDTSFNPETVGVETISAVVVQQNGKIIIGGSNFSLRTFVRGNIARLNADGTADGTFNQGRGANSDVQALLVQNGGKILIGGTFFRYHKFPRGGLARINL